MPCTSSNLLLLVSTLPETILKCSSIICIAAIFWGNGAAGATRAQRDYPGPLRCPSVPFTGPGIRTAPPGKPHFLYSLAYGRRYQLGEGGHSSENAVCFWNPHNTFQKETASQGYASRTADAMATRLCNDGA